MQQATIIGIDLAKRAFQAHGAAGVVQLSRTTNTMRLVDDIWQMVASEGIDHPDIVGECGWDGHALRP